MRTAPFWQVARSGFGALLLLCTFCRVGWADPLVLSPSLTISEQYNDNLYFDERGVADFVTSIHQGLGLTYERPRLTLSLLGGNASRLYADQTQQNSASSEQNGTLAVQSQLSERLSLHVADSVTHVDRTRNGPPPGSASAPAGEQPSPDLQASTLLSRGSALTNSFSSYANYRLAPLWTGSLTYSNSLSDFTDPGGSDTTNRVGLSLGYAWRPTTSFNANYSYARFDNQNFPNTESHNPTLGFSHHFDPTWSLVASAGVYVNTGVSTHVGPTFNLTTTRLLGHASLIAGVAQQITSSGGVASASKTLTAFVGYQTQLFEKMSGSLNCSYGHFDTDETTYDFVNATAALNVAFWRYFNGGLSYSYRWRDNSQATSSTTAGVVDGNLVQLYVSASYPIWRGDI